MTNDNLSYRKELMSIVNEVRHLDGIKGNFTISESEYLATTGSHDKIKPADITTALKMSLEYKDSTSMHSLTPFMH